MKTIKTLSLLSLLFISSLGFAQPPRGGQGGQGGPPPMPDAEQIEEMVAELSAELSLTQPQEEKILDLYTGHFEEMKELTSGNSRPSREDMEALKVEFEENVKKVLSDEQISKYEAYMKKQNSKRRR